MTKKSDYKLKMREEARKKLRGPSGGVTGSAEYRARIERGRKQLLENAAPGAGQARQARIQGELNYLINNYAPSNDFRIEQMIDEWRCSGDPDYDPGIKIKFRNARQRHMKNDNPI